MLRAWFVRLGHRLPGVAGGQQSSVKHVQGAGWHMRCYSDPDAEAPACHGRHVQRHRGARAWPDARALDRAARRRLVSARASSSAACRRACSALAVSSALRRLLSDSFSLSRPASRLSSIVRMRFCALSRCCFSDGSCLHSGSWARAVGVCKCRAAARKRFRPAALTLPCTGQCNASGQAATQAGTHEVYRFAQMCTAAGHFRWQVLTVAA